MQRCQDMAAARHAMVGRVQSGRQGRVLAAAAVAAGLMAAPAALASDPRSAVHSALAELAATGSHLDADWPDEGVQRFAQTLDRIVAALNGPSPAGERIHVMVAKDPGAQPRKARRAVLESGPDDGRRIQLALNKALAGADAATQADWIVGGIVNQALERTPGYADEASWLQAQAARALLLAKSDVDSILSAARPDETGAVAAAEAARKLGRPAFESLGFGTLMRKAAEIGLTLFAQNRLRSWQYDLGDRGDYRISVRNGTVTIRDRGGNLDNSNKDGTLAGPAVFPADAEAPAATSLKFFRGGTPMSARPPSALSFNGGAAGK